MIIIMIISLTERQRRYDNRNIINKKPLEVISRESLLY